MLRDSRSDGLKEGLKVERGRTKEENLVGRELEVVGGHSHNVLQLNCCGDGKWITSHSRRNE